MAAYGVRSPPPAGYGHTSPHPPAPVASTSYAAYQQQHAYKPGTLPAGVTIGIGQYIVTIERFLSEGGFAHVYLCYSSEPIPKGSNTFHHVLKRVAVPDKETLKDVRWEVDVMKMVRGHKNIVNLIEASASPIPGTTGYEVFILMEYCAGGGIIDMMNTRLQNRLRDDEILKIFSDVVEGVCWMHTREPPLIHRDLKVENILLAGKDLYKLCDFGSSATPKPKPPQTMQEIQALEADLNKNTTLQYRAPEMCDVWSRKGVGLPADIWALGVFLYKLCFYTTPFEEQGPLAILNVQYKMPSYPNYSPEIRKLITKMLVESPSQRPTAYDVHVEVCRMRGTQPNLTYRSSARLTSPVISPALTGVSPSNLPSRPPSSSLEQVLRPLSAASKTGDAPVMDVNGIPPMRRGRPDKPIPSVAQSSSPAPSFRSEWQVPNGRFPSRTHSAGFEDSFVPRASTPSAPGPSPQEPPQQTRTAAATAAIFEELSAPVSSQRVVPTLNSLAATKSGQAFAPKAVPSGISAESTRRVTPPKPLGPRPVLGSGNSISAMNKTTVPEPLHVPKPGPVTESSSARPVDKAPEPIRQQSTPSNTLQAPARQSSQTSPTLLKEWKKRESEALMQASTMHRLASMSQERGTDERPVVERFPSIDDWEIDSFSPQDEKSDNQDDVQYAMRAKQQLVDLLGDDDDDDETDNANVEAAPIVYASPVSTPLAVQQENPIQPPMLHKHSSIDTLRRHDSIRSVQSSGRSPASTNVAPDSRKPPLRLMSETSTAIVAAGTDKLTEGSNKDESDSSDDDLDPESATGLHYTGARDQLRDVPGFDDDFSVQSFPSAAAKIGSEGGNAKPNQPPPILAPKPTRGGISGIVSRYETISRDPEPRRESSLPPSASSAPPPLAPRPQPKLDKPTKPPKPGNLAPSPSMEEFQGRFPALDSESSRPNDMPSSATRQPFKPSRENSMNASSWPSPASELRNRPKSMHIPTPPRSMSGTPNLTKASKHDSHEEEEHQHEDGIKGVVANLRDRWQKTIASHQHHPSTGSAGLGRRSTVNNGNAGRYKS